MATRADAIDYTDALGEAVCEHVAGGGTVRKFCEGEGRPSKSAVFRWLAKYPAFMALYNAAVLVKADALADEMLDIADGDDDPSKVRNQLATRQWLAARHAPKKYGDKLALDHAGEVGLKVVVRRFTPEPEPAE